MTRSKVGLLKNTRMGFKRFCFLRFNKNITILKKWPGGSRRIPDSEKMAGNDAEMTRR